MQQTKQAHLARRVGRLQLLTMWMRSSSKRLERILGLLRTERMLSESKLRSIR